MISVSHPSFTFAKSELPQIKASILAWASQFPYACVLDNCGSEIDEYGRYELLVGVSRSESGLVNKWEEIHTYQDQWLMGVFPYELKNIFEPKLKSQYDALVPFPETALFVPETVLYIERGGNEIKIQGLDAKWEQANLVPLTVSGPPSFSALVSKEAYLATIRRLQAHIKAGDFYEINLAQAFVASLELEHPESLYHELSRISPVPFSAFIKYGDKYVMSASPERFLQHHNGRLLTQPMKGTAARTGNPLLDQKHVDYLSNSIKEQAENVMIVDLSRNDLYKSAIPHTVEVPELFKIQAFPQVYQMISTITARKRPELAWSEVLKNTFPAGSMTGAPKFKSMEMIDRYEVVARGVYAGSAGYIQPNGDFDFNVIIRSLVYDQSRKALNYHVGGAITYDSDPDSEYAETLLKAAAIRKLFQ